MAGRRRGAPQGEGNRQPFMHASAGASVILCTGVQVLHVAEIDSFVPAMMCGLNCP